MFICMLPNNQISDYISGLIFENEIVEFTVSEMFYKGGDS